MRIVSNTIAKTTLLAFLPCLFLTFFSCSQLEQTSTSSVTLKLNTSRAASLSDSETKVDVELKGGFSASQTAVVIPGQQLTLTFTDVPVGASVYASAQIYSPYENEKSVLYSGKSETKVIKDEGNTLEVILSIEYNHVIETSNAYIVSRPLFIVERDKRQLTTNKLEFKNSEVEEKRDETFRWDFDRLQDFQKARITIRGSKFKGDEENLVKIKYVKTNTGAIYTQGESPVRSEAVTYEFDIPQYIGLNSIGLENFWDSTPGINTWAGDFSCFVDKIELLKDSSAIDPAFNVVTKTPSTYTVKNPVIQTIVYTDIYRNKIGFNSKQAYDETGSEYAYSAAYWEFADLAQYDKIYIKLKRTDSEDSENKLILRGYTPFDYSINQMSRTSEYPTDVETEPYYKTFLDYDSVQISADVIDFKTGLDKLTAISFQNNSFIEDPDHPGKFNYGNKWAIEIEEIQLVKLGNITIQVDVPEYQDIDVAKTEQKSGGNVTGWKFTAPSGYTSYVWKINDEVQSGSAISSGGTVFTFTKPNISHGPVYYDLTLLASDGTRNDSWNCQITVNVN